MSRILQGRVGRWGKETFPDATVAGISNHLVEEANEVREAIATVNRIIEEDPTQCIDFDIVFRELADCHLLLLHLAERMGVDLDYESNRRFESVKNRTFGPSDTGYWKTTSGGDDEQ